MWLHVSLYYVLLFEQSDFDIWLYLITTAGVLESSFVCFIWYKILLCSLGWPQIFSLVPWPPQCSLLNDHLPAFFHKTIVFIWRHYILESGVCARCFKLEKGFLKLGSFQRKPRTVSNIQRLFLFTGRFSHPLRFITDLETHFELW